MTDPHLSPRVPRDADGALRPDLLVIGAGSAGLSAAAGAARLGVPVVLCEADRMGGDCLNTGCVPSKALIAAAAAAHAARGGRAGIAAADTPPLDPAAIRAHVAGAVAAIAPHDSQERFEGLGVEVIRAAAAFASPETVEAGGLTIRPRRILIATGSTAAVPPIPGLAETPYLTNESLFDLEDLPERLLILGAGPIGLEMAQAHRRLGAEVTVIDAGPALSREDPETAAVALAALRAEGVAIHERRAIARVSGEPGAVRIETADGESHEGTHLLVAAGRIPALEALRPERGGVETDARGIKVDAGLRSVSNRRVHAAGDVAGGPQFTHAAGWHAGLAIRAILFRLPVKADAPVPRVTYLSPEIAQAGLTEAEARTLHGDGIEVLRAEFTGNDRAVAEGGRPGLLKVIVRKGRPIGASLVGPHAGELIALWQLAISKRMKIGDIAGMVLPYPTLSEISKRAAGAYYEDRLFSNPWVKRAIRLLARLG